MTPQLPDHWEFDGRPAVNSAKAKGMMLETRMLDNSYYRAELLVEDPDTVKTKRRWLAGVWANADTCEGAIKRVEGMAIMACLVLLAKNPEG